LLTLLSNSAYSNISSLLHSDSNRLPAEDTLTIVNGVSGAYPNVFLQLSEPEIPDLVTRIEQLRSEADYYRAAEVISSGVLDYGRYENR
jgi:hypothetical protein